MALFFGLLNTQTVLQRVQFWNYLALTQRREETDKQKKMLRKEGSVLKNERNRTSYDSGGMAYGSNYHRLMLNPFRLKKCVDNVLFSKLATNYLVKDLPKILLDVQYVKDASNRETRLLGEQTEKIMEAHFYYSKRSFPIEFINMNRKFLNMEYFLGKIGFCARNEDRKKGLLPDIHENNPYYKDMKNKIHVPESDQIVYLSRHAKNVLDGPLIHKAYVIPISWDQDKESLANCRINKFRTMCLPIDKYIKWQSGAKAIPFVNIYKILMDLTTNGCDWEKALRNNIAKRHFVTSEESIQKMGIHQHRQREYRENLFKIVNLIEEAVKNIPEH